MKHLLSDPHAIWYLVAATACAGAGVIESWRRTRKMRHREGLFTDKERKRREKKEKK